MKFDRDFYLKDTFEVAEDLLGATLHTNINGELASGKIVELELYMGSIDKGSHAYGGKRTTRNEVMYHMGGVAYIYLIYGLHSLFNIVTGMDDVAHAILIRALEPVEGIKIMEDRRNTNDVLNLTSGPGKLCSALNITRDLNGVDLTGNVIWIEPPKEKL
ncbi:MAG: DNA-3-methyladenine glycosylase, partial [Candidatus Aminicenantes bacterium]|nr:DNA-3-methyladenine glycosylase [Candidatus Aminicenantes bacterium]